MNDQQPPVARPTSLVPFHPIATEVSVDADDAWAEAGRHVIGVQFANMRARTDATASNGDVEQLHVMRVSARRMRTAWLVFHDAFEPFSVKRYRSRLRDVGAVLGRARDIDVQLAFLQASTARRRPNVAVALGPLASAWKKERAGVQAEIVTLVRSSSFRNLCRELEEFSRTDGFLSRGGTETPPPVWQSVGTRTWTAYEAVLAFDGDLSGASDSRLHDLRIAVKRLRYTIEFVRDPLGPTSASLLNRLVTLQDRLGEVHDCTRTATRAEDFLAADREVSTKERTAVIAFVREQRRLAARARRGLVRAWAPVCGARFRADLGACLATAYRNRAGRRPA